MKTQFDKLNEFEQQRQEINAALQERAEHIEAAEAELSQKSAQLAQEKAAYTGAEGQDASIDALEVDIATLKKRVDRLQASRPANTQDKISYEDLIDAWRSEFYPKFSAEELDPVYAKMAKAKSDYLEAKAEVESLLREADSLRTSVASTFNKDFPYAFQIRKPQRTNYYFTAKELGL